MKVRTLAAAIAIALAASTASAAVFVAPTVKQSDTILNTTNTTLRTNLINIWLTSYQTILNTNKTYLDKVAAMTPTQQAATKLTEAYKYQLDSYNYYKAEVDKITSIKNGTYLTGGSTTTVTTPTAVAAPITSVIDAPAGSDIYTLGTPTAGYVGKTPESFRTAEFLRSTGLSQIKAEYAWSQGWTGKGVTVAVIDTGYSSTQKSDRIVNLAQGKNFLDNNTNVDDTLNHGTHVAGIIAAPLNGTGVVGVAPDATILPLKAVGTSLSTAQMATIANAVDYAAQQKVHVINMSIGYFTSYDMATKDTSAIDAAFGQAYLKAVQAGSTVVVAAGNNGMSCQPFVTKYDWSKSDPVVNKPLYCSFPAALPAVAGYESLTTSKGGWIVVGAVDSNNNLASFSNKAGVMKDYYMVAPGVGITSTVANDATANKNGTSMAAPYVSGAMALLSQKFPYLTGSQKAAILFQTATDLGAPGVDEVYGNGLLNIEKAMQPIGQLRLPTGQNVDSASKPIGSAVIVTNSVVGTALLQSTVLKNTMVLDDYNRSYGVDMTKAVYGNTVNFSFDNLRTYNIGQLSVSTDGTQAVKAMGYSFDNGFMVRFANDTQPGTNGNYWRFGYEQAVSQTRSLGATLDYGVVRIDAGSSGLIQSVSPMTMLGASGWLKMQLSRKETATVGVRLPMTPVSGSATVRVPVARTMEGDVVYASEKVSLAQRPTEFALFATYGKQIDRTSALFGYVSAQYSTISNKMATAAQVTYAWYF